MKFLTNPGRRAGVLYLIGSIPGFFALLYVPSRLIVHGDAAATAHNIVASETLFRLGIFADLICQGFFLVVAIALYDLLKSVNRRLAVLMVVLIAIPIPIGFLNEVNSIAALTLAQGGDFLRSFDESQRFALMKLFLNLRGTGFDIAAIFWGLWLFPLGLLVYRSGFIPRLLGALLMAACFAYLANSFTALVLPRYETAVSRWMSPIELAEMLFMLWLLVRGATPRPEEEVIL